MLTGVSRFSPELRPRGTATISLLRLQGGPVSTDQSLKSGGQAFSASSLSLVKDPFAIYQAGAAKIATAQKTTFADSLNKLFGSGAQARIAAKNTTPGFGSPPMTPRIAAAQGDSAGVGSGLDSGGIMQWLPAIGIGLLALILFVKR